jgi:hypothetical protein
MWLVLSEPVTGDGRFPSDHAFRGFIGFVSNPTRALHLRSLTQMWPIPTSSR